MHYITFLGFFVLCTELHAEIFDLIDATPWLQTAKGQVAFSSGWDSFVVADSSCVRINQRGIQAKPSHWTPRELSVLWKSKVCIPGSGAALCVMQGGGMVFPERELGRLPFYNASGGWANFKCSRSSDGRAMNPAYAYDVSSCDILDGGDVVLCGRVLYYAFTSLPEWSYWLLCICAVFLVRSLSYLVVERVDHKLSERGSMENWLIIGACVLVLILTLIPDGDSYFVTIEDYLFFDLMCAYTVMYIILFAVFTWYSHWEDPPIYNLIAGTLQVVSSRLYLSADTPYNPVIIWAVATRALVKIRSGPLNFIMGLSTLFDSMVLSLMCTIGWGFNPLYHVAIFSLALATSDVL